MTPVLETNLETDSDKDSECQMLFSKSKPSKESMFDKIINLIGKNYKTIKIYLKNCYRWINFDFSWDPGYNFNSLNNFNQFLNFPNLLSYQTESHHTLFRLLILRPLGVSNYCMLLTICHMTSLLSVRTDSTANLGIQVSTAIFASLAKPLQPKKIFGCCKFENLYSQKYFLAV